MTSRSVQPDGLALLGRPGLAGRPLLAPQPEQAAQLGQRVGVVVDADVEVGEILGGGQQHGGRLLAAPVAAGGLARLHRRHQALGQLQVGARLRTCRRWRRPPRRPASMLPATETCSPVRSPHHVDAMPAGPGGGAAVPVDGVDLAQVAALVGGRARARWPRTASSPRSIRSRMAGPEVAVGERLRRDGADARAHDTGSWRRRRRRGSRRPRRRRPSPVHARRSTRSCAPHFFSMFQNTTLVATSTPVTFLRKAEGCSVLPESDVGRVLGGRAAPPARRSPSAWPGRSPWRRHRAAARARHRTASRTSPSRRPR